jgi:hypothetical protein
MNMMQMQQQPMNMMQMQQQPMNMMQMQPMTAMVYEDVTDIA